MRCLNRRDLFRHTLQGVGAFGLPSLFRLRAESGPLQPGQDTSLILLWQDGGATHLETFDPKPEAPREYRGEFGSIPTTLPGIHFSELFPRLARRAHQLAILRSLHQASSDHVSATHSLITGYDRTGVVFGPPDHPDLGAVIHKVRSGKESLLPDYTALMGGLHRGGPAYLGRIHTPYEPPGDPSEPGFRAGEILERNPEIPTARLRERMYLLANFDKLGRDLDASGQFEAMDSYHQRALKIVSSQAAASAFDLTQEDPRLRESYGLHSAGQQVLLARRLVEAGVSVVTTRFSPDGRGDGDRSYIGWDDHAVHGNIFEIMKRRAPQFDQAVSALIDDLIARGLDRKVLVVVVGEFGRTPRISYKGGNPGRDHWGAAGCALVFGGGLRMGQVIGSTNHRGEHPVDRPLRPQDLLATIYHSLGIDTHRAFQNHAGRPVPILPHGEPIRELVG